MCQATGTCVRHSTACGGCNQKENKRSVCCNGAWGKGSPPSVQTALLPRQVWCVEGARRAAAKAGAKVRVVCVWCAVWRKRSVAVVGRKGGGSVAEGGMVRCWSSRVMPRRTTTVTAGCNGGVTNRAPNPPQEGRTRYIQGQVRLTQPERLRRRPAAG